MAKKETFGEKYERLEQLSHYFEKGDLDIDEALTKFEEGVGLVKELQKHLDSVENKIADIKQKLQDV